MSPAIGPIDHIASWMSRTIWFRRLLRFLPPVFERRVKRLYAPEVGPWPDFTATTPPSLLEYAGVKRDRYLETAAFEESPIPSFNERYPKAVARVYAFLWHSVLPTSPRYMRGRVASEHSVKAAAAMAPQAKRLPDDATLTGLVRAKAAELGLSAIGIAAYNEQYAFAPHLGKQIGDRVIVCLLEQNYEMTQETPSVKAERAALHAYAECMMLAADLAKFIRSQGYRAESHTPEGKGISIQYGVETGLGQLGLNGQLLTPQAGSRVRLIGINTDAPLTVDGPRDFGIPKICDQCQVCVQRCPSNAIPSRRFMYRGVEKAKINTKRCLPLIGQASGCAVCMRVCPVQKYGLEKIYDEYERSGAILGKGTPELENYTWPMDGRTYTIGERPQFDKDVFFDLDPGPEQGPAAPSDSTTGS